eukprot:6172071-Pleurochrysis_carterae.AAC.2
MTRSVPERSPCNRHCCLQADASWMRRRRRNRLPGCRGQSSVVLAMQFHVLSQALDSRRY